jgi:ribosomal-protein-alanine N-acetyltransferase
MALPNPAPAPLPLPVAITPMAQEHLSEVYAIEIAAYPRPWPFKCFTDELFRNKFAHYFVGLDNTGAVRGYAGMWMIHDEGHITNIAVDPEWRRRKIAEQILVHIINHCMLRGMRSIFLEVRRYNLPAQMLYTRYKFTPVSVRERYYADNDEDAIILRVQNLDAPVFRENFERQRSVLRCVLEQDR